MQYCWVAINLSVKLSKIIRSEVILTSYFRSLLIWVEFNKSHIKCRKLSKAIVKY